MNEILAHGAPRQKLDVFNAAGLPALVEPDMPLWLHCHVPLCVAFESVSVASERGGGGAIVGRSDRPRAGNARELRAAQGTWVLVERAGQHSRGEPAL